MNPYSINVENRKGCISPTRTESVVDNYTFKIGDIVPYKNTRSNVSRALIESFINQPNGTVWFTGTDIKTKAAVWYGLHCSLDIMREEP
jgi:hypothetical protein